MHQSIPRAPETPARPRIHIIDPSVDFTGAFIAARNEAHLLKNFANVTISLPLSSLIPLEALAVFDDSFPLAIENPPRSLSKLPTYLMSLLKATRNLAAYLRMHRIDVLQVNTEYLLHGVLVRLFGYRGRIVTWIRIDPDWLGSKTTQLLLAVICMASDEIVAVSHFVAKKLNRRRINVVYDPFVVGENLQRGVAPDDETKRIVMIANYIEGKGHDQAIEAFALLNATHYNDVVLEFFGGDMGRPKNKAYKRDLERRAAELGIADRIKFNGFAPNPAIVLAKASVALVMSRNESFSLTCLEAAGLGCPVVATRCGGPEEIIDHEETGILVPVGDAAATAEAIEALLADPESARRMSELAAFRTRKRFSREAFLAGVRDVFDIPMPLEN